MGAGSTYDYNAGLRFEVLLVFPKGRGMSSFRRQNSPPSSWYLLQPFWGLLAPEITWPSLAHNHRPQSWLD